MTQMKREDDSRSKIEGSMRMMESAFHQDTLGALADASPTPTVERVDRVKNAVEAAFTGRGSAATGGGKLSRTETVTVRLDPKLRYLAELAARKQRRTLSSYIEWAVEKSLADVVLTTRYSGEELQNEDLETVADKADELWDVDPSERFARLAITHPSLLGHDEQVLWKQIEDSGVLAKGWIPPTKDGVHWTPGHPDWKWLKQVGFPRLRDHWRTLCDVAEGRLDRSAMPRFAE